MGFASSAAETACKRFLTDSYLVRCAVLADLQISVMRSSDSEKLEKHFQEMLAEKVPRDGSPVEVYDMLDIMLLETVIDIFVDPAADPDYKYIHPRPFVDGVNALLKINTFRVLLGYVSLVQRQGGMELSSLARLQEY